jgi:hypothetical protein
MSFLTILPCVQQILGRFTLQTHHEMAYGIGQAALSCTAMTISALSTIPRQPPYAFDGRST